MEWLKIFSVIQIYFILYYILECFVWVLPKNLLIKIKGKSFEVSRDFFSFTSLFPLGRYFLIADYPVYFTRKGVYTPAHGFTRNLPYAAQNDFDFRSYDDINSIKIEDRKLIIDGETVFKTGGRLFSKHLLKKAEQLLNTSEQNRSRIINEQMNDEVNLEAIKTLQTSTKFYRKSLIALSMGFLFLMMFWMPLAPKAAGLNKIWLWASLALLGLTYVSGLCLYGRALYKVKGKVTVGELLIFLLVPLSAGHFPLYLDKTIYAPYHYLAVIGSFHKNRSLKDLIKREIAQCKRSKERPYSDDLKEWALAKEKSFIKLAFQLGFRESDVKGPPEKSSSKIEKYCELCHAEYYSKAEMCTSCHVALVEF